MRKTKIVIPLYQSELIIIQDKNWKKINRKYNINGEKYFGAFTFRNLKKSGRMQYVVCFDSNPSNSLIAHEATHLTNILFKDFGFKLDVDNDEPQAYLLAWFVEQIDEFLK